MTKGSLSEQIVTGLRDACYVWRKEMKQVFRDEGVLIFFIIVPLIYPLLYSWIYNNEVVRDVPVVVVDNSHTNISREFIRKCDASPDVHVMFYADGLEEAKALVSRQLVCGIYYLPSDFENRLLQMQQSTVSVYCDMSLMLTYKAIYQTAIEVSQLMNSELQKSLSGKYTTREEAITAHPLTFDAVPIFNPSGGYGSFILPGVLMLILQQTLVLGIGMAAGTARERNRYSDLVSIKPQYQGTFRVIFGKSMCYFMIFAVMAAYLSLAVPRFFNFPHIAGVWNIAAIMLPYLLACIFFGITVSCLVRYRENVMLLVVFISVPLLFLSGISWPGSAMPWFWECISWLFPSTFGIRAYVRLNSMGATLADVANEYHAIWIHVFAYFVLACGVYRFQISESHRHAMERLEFLKHKRAVRQMIKDKKMKSGSQK